MKEIQPLAHVFGKRLKYLREKAQLSQGQLAKMLEVSRGAISFYENGERTPNIDFLQDTAHFFGVDYNYLMGDISTYRNTSSDDFSYFSNETIERLRSEQDLGEGLWLQELDSLLKNEKFYFIVHEIAELSEAYGKLNRAKMNGERAVLTDLFGCRTDVDYIVYRLSQLFCEVCKQVALDVAYQSFTEDEKEQYAQFIKQCEQRISEYDKLKTERSLQMDEEFERYREELASLSVITEDMDYFDAIDIVQRRIHGDPRQKITNPTDDQTESEENS